MLIASDASMKGWGVFCPEQETGDPWSNLEARKRINVLQLKAGNFAILTFRKIFPDVKVFHLQMDNMMALSYVKKMGVNTTSSFRID